MRVKQIVTANVQEMSQRGAAIVAAQLTLKSHSVLGLATGSTPLGMYAELVSRNKAGEISFADARTINLDEYCDISADNKNSYRYYMNSNFFDKIDIRKENTYLPDGMASDKQAECARYSELVDALGGIDLQVLGIGMNGHIGFNEPAAHFVMDTNCVTLTESTRNVNAQYFDGGLDEMPRYAITMGLRQIMQAKRILLLAGANKKGILEEALNGPVTPQVPASILQLHKRLTVIISES